MTLVQFIQRNIECALDVIEVVIRFRADIQHDQIDALVVAVLNNSAGVICTRRFSSIWSAV